MRWAPLLLALWACDDGATPAAEADVGVDGRVPDAQPDGPPEAIPDALPDAAAEAPDGPTAPTPDAGLEPDADVDAVVDHAAPITAEGPWAPAARVTVAEVPQTPVAARRAGCALHGNSAGTDVRNVFQVLGGGLRRFLDPNPMGLVQLVILIQADWPAGTSALDLAQTRLTFYDGHHLDAAEFRVTHRSFVDEDPAQGPRVVMDPVTVDDGWLETHPTDVLVPLPLLSATTVLLELKEARLVGRVAADGPGFRIDRGALGGYLTNDGLRDLVAQVQVLCRSDDPPGVCALVGGQIEQPLDDVVELVRGIVGQPDVMLEGRAARDCNRNEEDCNAVAVCLALSARGVEIAGVLQATPSP